MNAPRGFSLVEVLCAIFVISLLMALTLPALQGSRESARRLQCVNNLKQIGIALNHYEATHGRFPAIISPTGFNPGRTVPYSLHCYSPIARMLGELDQPVLFNATNFTDAPSLGAGLSANLTVMMSSLNVCVCPSERSTAPDGYGRVNYRFNIGPTPWSAPGVQYPETFSGPFSTHKFYRPADFSDGLSTTIGVSERIQGDWTKSGVDPGDYRLTKAGDDKNLGGADWAAATCLAAPPDTPRESRAGESWFLSGLHFTNYNHCWTPNHGSLDCSFSPFGTEGIHDRVLQEGVFTARSHHQGGVNVMGMDGSVRFVGNQIALEVWRAIATRSGNEVTTGY